jgi:U3 small nucleolar ribonucleoprotein protein LCP5
VILLAGIMDQEHFLFTCVTFSDGDESWAEKQQRALERARKRALGSSVMQELQEEYFDRPSEVSHCDVAKATLAQQHRHKEE